VSQWGEVGKLQKVMPSLYGFVKEQDATNVNTTRNHGLFDLLKTKPRINHLDIWSI
jgi:hypothetical protein